MIRQELYKIFGNKTIFIFIVVLLINAAQLLYLENKASVWDADDYNEVWGNITGTDDTGIKIKERIDEYVSEINAEWELMDREDQYYAKINNDTIYVRRELLLSVQNEVEKTIGYNDYLDSIDDTVRRYEMLAVFSDPDIYAYKELLKVQSLYDSLDKKEMTPEPSAGISMASKADVTDILALILILYLTVTVWLKEREQGMLLLIRTTGNGRIKLAISKLTVLVFLCFCIAFALYGSNFILADIMYDMGSFSRPLAAVSDYRSTLWEITVGQFLLLNVLFKSLSYIFIMLLLSVICLIVKASVAAFAGIIMVSGIGCFMYYKIPAVSVWVTFKYLNPFGVLKTEMFFEGYRGLNFFEQPVDYRYCIIGLFCLGDIVFTILAVKLFIGYIIKGKHKSVKLLKKTAELVVKLRRKIEMHTSVLLHELHRILIYNGVFAVTAIAMILIMADLSSNELKYYSEEDYYEAQYLIRLEGPVTDEKIEFIESEYERLLTPADSSEKAQQKAIKRIKSRLLYIMANEGACFIYDVPHNKLTAEAGYSEDFLRAVYVMLLLVLCMPGFFAPDLQSGMYRIIEVTAKGRRKLKCLRYVLGSILAVLFVLMVHLLRYIDIMREYGVKAEVMTYPVNSLMHLGAFGSSITVGAYYLLLFLLWTLSAIIGAVLVYRLSMVIKSMVYTMFAGIVVLVFPMLIALYSDEFLYASYPHSVFAGNLFLQNKNAAFISIVAWVLFFVAERILTIFVRAGRKGK